MRIVSSIVIIDEFVSKIVRNGVSINCEKSREIRENSFKCGKNCENWLRCHQKIRISSICHLFFNDFILFDVFISSGTI